MNSKIIKEIRNLISEVLDEMTSTGDVAGYNSAYAFTNSTSKMGDYFKKQGYDVVDKDVTNNDNSNKNKNRKNNNSISNLVTKVISNMNLSEVNYKQFKTDNSQTNKQKINISIKQINSDLYKLEQTLNHVIKLKTESDMHDDKYYWKPTKSRIQKIQSRLNSITNKIKKLG